ncbi:hypothetical protein SAMN05216569_1753 [Pseudoxanthomonas sp. CF125]|nr:hypothetical protein SAMN05216569_1753 [Pseudoxanthomonas sp. CF125]
MKASDSLLPLGEGGAKRRMREWQSLANQLHYKRTTHSLIRPSGTFSRREKEKLITFAMEFHA